MFIADLGFGHAINPFKGFLDRDRTHGAVHGWQIKGDGLRFGPVGQTGDGEYKGYCDFVHDSLQSWATHF